MTDRPATGRAPDSVALPGAIAGGQLHGLDYWFEAAEFDMVFWTAPPGTTATLEVAGDGADAAELQWSTRCSALPPTRAVVLLGGTGFEGIRDNFETAHLAAEAVAGFVTEESGAEAGPIEVLVFRPDTAVDPDVMDGSAAAVRTWPQPTGTTDGAQFRFRHRGGGDVRLHLTVPQTTHPDSGGKR